MISEQEKVEQLLLHKMELGRKKANNEELKQSMMTKRQNLASQYNDNYLPQPNLITPYNSEVQNNFSQRDDPDLYENPQYSRTMTNHFWEKPRDSVTPASPDKAETNDDAFYNFRKDEFNKKHDDFKVARFQLNKFINDEPKYIVNSDFKKARQWFQIPQQNISKTPLSKRQNFEPVKMPYQIKKQQPMNMIIVKDYGFQKSNLIGTGSFSRVYKGQCISDPNLTVAIKEIKISEVGNQKLMQEINIHKSMNDSQYIVQILDFSIERNKDICYLVLEYCPQGSLEKQYKSLTRAKALQYFSQLLEAMNDLKKRNIIHRDLKLENILIKNNEIKLADFGFARPLPDNQLSVQSQKCGTPATMAPELIFNDSNRVSYTDKQDVWSLGVILHELIYKEHPFAQNKERMKRNQRVFVQNKDPVVENFLEKSLQSDPHKRMTLQECLNHEINNNFQQTQLQNIIQSRVQAQAICNEPEIPVLQREIISRSTQKHSIQKPIINYERRQLFSPQRLFEQKDLSTKVSEKKMETLNSSWLFTLLLIPIAYFLLIFWLQK